MIKPLYCRQKNNCISFEINQFGEKINNVTILRYGSIIKKISRFEINDYIDESEFIYPNLPSGCYSIIVEADQLKYVSNNPILVYSEQDLKEFTKLIQKNNSLNNRLTYFPGNDVYSDWLVTNYKCVNQLDHLYHYAVNDCYSIFTQFPLQKNDNNLFYLSGYQVTNEHGLILGQKNIKDLCKINKKNIGRFTVLEIDQIEKESKITNDYFGLEKIFIYTNKDKFIISNRYHLLLKSIYILDLRVTIDYDVVASILCSNIWMFSLNHFIRKTIYKEIKILGVEECLSINKQGILSIANKDIFDIFNKSGKFSSNSEKDSLLNDISSELKKNIRNACNNNYVKLADLTAGVDSRLALSTFPLTDVRFNESLTLRTLRIGKDWEISNKIADYFDLSYIKADYYQIAPLQINKQKRSWLMGTYYKYVPIKNEYLTLNSKEKYIKFNGGAGEAFTRPYTCNHIGLKFANEIASLSENEFISQVLLSLQQFYPSFISSKVDSLKKVLIEDFRATPGLNNLLKLENIYLSFRTPFHFNTFSSNYEELVIFPVISTKLFEVYVKSLNVGDDFNLAIELTEKNNPLLNRFEYDKAEYNKYANLKFNIKYLSFDGDYSPKYRSFDELNCQSKDSVQSKINEYNNAYNSDFYHEEIVKHLLHLATTSDKMLNICFDVYIYNKYCTTKSNSMNVSMLSRLQTINDQINEVSYD